MTNVTAELDRLRTLAASLLTDDERTVMGYVAADRMSTTHTYSWLIDGGPSELGEPESAAAMSLLNRDFIKEYGGGPDRVLFTDFGRHVWEMQETTS